MRRANLVYLAMVGVFALGAATLLSVACGLDPMVVTLLVLAGIALFGVVAPGVRSNRRRDRAEAAERDSCQPILRHYRRKKDAARLLDDYRRWSEQGRDPATRALFSQSVVSVLIRDGHYDEAREVLSDGLEAATRARLGEEYRRFVKTCKDRMGADG